MCLIFIYLIIQSIKYFKLNKGNQSDKYTLFTLILLALAIIFMCLSTASSLLMTWVTVFRIKEMTNEDFQEYWVPKVVLIFTSYYVSVTIYYVIKNLALLIYLSRWMQLTLKLKNLINP